MAKRVPRLMRAVDFVADSLETEAAKMPPSAQGQADALRKAAKVYRESSSTKMVRVWEDAKDAEDFIHPDPASVRR